nr:hypothetical protein [Tanacetum cinerariifolium]
MALSDDELTVGKSHARNGEWVDITIRKCRDELLSLKQVKLDAVTIQIQNIELTKLYHDLQEHLNDEKRINEKWLTSSKKVSQCISEQIPHQKKKVIGGHNHVIHIRWGVLAESFQSNESLFRVKCSTCGSTVHSTSDHNEFDHFKRVNEIEIDDSSRYPPDEFLHEDISYYVIPHGQSLTELTQENHVPEVIVPNEHGVPLPENIEDPPDLINTKETHEKNV